MVALVGLKPSIPCPWIECLDELPQVSTIRWSAFIVALPCTSEENLLEWVVEVARVRPWTRIVILGYPGRILRTALKAAAGVNHDIVLLPPDDVTIPYASAEVIESCWRHSIAANIVDDWLEATHVRDRRLTEILRLAASTGCRGGTADGMCTRWQNLNGPCKSTIQRTLRAAGLPLLGWLVRDARLKSVNIRIQRGAPKRSAHAASGWSDHSSYLRAAKRAGASLAHERPTRSDQI